MGDNRFTLSAVDLDADHIGLDVEKELTYQFATAINGEPKLAPQGYLTVQVVMLCKKRSRCRSLATTCDLDMNVLQRPQSSPVSHVCIAVMSHSYLQCRQAALDSLLHT